MSVNKLVAIVRRLRGPDGCPWDKAQTPESLRSYVVEELYELLDAIEDHDDAAQREELGDLLFQIVLLAEMAHQRGAFDLDEVADDIAEKMVRRHPHVFGDADAEGHQQTWERLKAESKPERTSLVDGVPRALPALVRAHRVGVKVGRVGFDWPDHEGARAKVDEELRELDEAVSAGEPAAIEAEYGDALLAMVSLGRKLGLGAEESLRAANRRFEGRFRTVEELAGARPLNRMSPEELDALWQEAKSHV